MNLNAETFVPSFSTPAQAPIVNSNLNLQATAFVPKYKQNPSA
ncbi:MAG: hypothetical protein ACMG6E_04395 [Candidatus Roizmanbacteria bacterium]